MSRDRRWTPNDSSPGVTPTPKRRSPPTTPKETWSRSTGRTSGWVSKRATNCVWQASTAKQTPSISPDKDGNPVTWAPNKLAARTGGAEVYRSETMELRQGDRIRWTRNDKSLGLVNSQTADVTGVKNGTVTFTLEDGRVLELEKGDSQLRHIDRAWASTVHAFQGRTVDTVIAAMEANHPHLTTQKTLYVEISRARERAELVTDDRDTLRERLEAATGERIAALEAVEPVRAPSASPEKAHEIEDARAPIGSSERVQRR